MKTRDDDAAVLHSNNNNNNRTLEENKQTQDRKINKNKRIVKSTQLTER